MNTVWRWTAAHALALGLVAPLAVRAQDAAALRAKQVSLRDTLETSPFHRPLVLASTQSAGNLQGEVYAIVDQPFSVTGPALQGMGRWCELLLLHLNAKRCSVAGQAPSEVLSLWVGRKLDAAPGGGYRVDFDYSVPFARSDYLRVQMAAAKGPLDTRDYRLALEAVALDAKRSFVHLSYAYSYGTVARMAMQAYLATAGRDKVGFSITGRTEDGKPIHVDGVRGAVERNAMRYYLAVEAYLGALSTPPGDRQEKRQRDWFASTERHPAQLHEMGWDEYLAMKSPQMNDQQPGAQR
jgi:hypothetical protein